MQTTKCQCLPIYHGRKIFPCQQCLFLFSFRLSLKDKQGEISCTVFKVLKRHFLFFTFIFFFFILNEACQIYDIVLSKFKQLKVINPLSFEKSVCSALYPTINDVTSCLKGVTSCFNGTGIMLGDSIACFSVGIYCLFQAQAPVLLEQLEREKELLRIFLHVSQSDNHLLRRMHLKSFLMVPVQRIMK